MTSHHRTPYHAAEAADGAGPPLPSRPLRLQVIGHRYHMDRFQKGFYDALDSVFDLDVVFVEDGWPEHSDEFGAVDADACMWYVRFSDLEVRSPFAWRDFPGRRLMYDEDALLNFSDVAGQHDYGSWPGVFARHQFDTLICTGKLTRDALIADGVPSAWLPKAYDPNRLNDIGGEREGLCYFGSRYPARRAMLAFLHKRKVEFTEFQSDHSSLNDHLNRYLGSLICNMQGTVAPGLNRYVNRLWPTRGVELAPGPETMLKNFEVAGAGCAPICDWIDEMEDLGFRDGVNMVGYEDFDELVEKIIHYRQRPDELSEIGQNAATLVNSRHTWLHRARQLESLLVASEI